MQEIKHAIMSGYINVQGHSKIWYGICSVEYTEIEYFIVIALIISYFVKYTQNFKKSAS
jgi:hypothetical protein